jgi:RNA polymerase sigma-70 factor (ECF subfamily)
MSTVAVLAKGPFDRFWHSQPGILTVLWDYARKSVSCIAAFAERVSDRIGDKVKEMGVPTSDLIRRFQSGQPRAFEALYDRFKDYVYRTAFFITRNSGEAEDAVQETFLDVLRALPNYDVAGPARFETWLYRVTVNRCRSRMRRKRFPTADWDEIEERLERIPEPHPGHSPEKIALDREQAVGLWQAVDTLSEEQRVTVLLRYQQGLSYGEIAETLGISQGTVKSRLYHAHRRLKEQLESEEGDQRGSHNELARRV